VNTYIGIHKQANVYCNPPLNDTRSMHHWCSLCIP